MVGAPRPVLVSDLTADTSPDARIGEVRVDRIVEGVPDAMSLTALSGPSAEALARHRPWMPDGWLGPRGLVLPISAFVLSTDDLTVLVDSCVGGWPTPLDPDGAPHSDFLDRLAAAGFHPEDIDVVVATHLHFDHVGSHTRRDADGRIHPTFPRARYLVAETEWRAQSGPHRANPALSSLDQAVRPLLESGQAELIAHDHQIGAGISVLATPGHSPGHLCVTIDSCGTTGIVTGDVAHSPVQLCVPEVGSVFDQEPDLAIHSRREVAGLCATEGTLVLGTHFPGLGIGTLERVDGEIRYVEAAPLGR